MTYMFVRNRVEDYARWRAVFDSHASAHKDAGFRLVNIWRAQDEPNNIFFLFEVDDVEAAQRFLDDPASAEAGAEAGCLDGEYYFLEPAET